MRPLPTDARFANPGLALGLLVALSMAALTAAAPAVVPPHPPMSAQQPSTAEAPEDERAPCSLVGTPLALDPANRTWAWSTLQNVGSRDATPSGLLAGWSGSAQLVQVVLEPSAGGQTTLFAGKSTSPANLWLAPVDGASAAIAPGETARLGLQFNVDGTGAPLVVGPTVLAFGEDCSLALHQVAGSGCGLSVTPILVSGNDPRRVIFSLVNGGTQALKLGALDVAWPVETNGRLTDLYLDSALVHTFADGLAHSPAILELDRLLEQPRVLGPGATLAVWLQFERTAADKPYVVTAATTGGCLATSTTNIDARACGMVSNDFVTRGSRLILRLTNSLPITQTMHSLDLFWPVGTNGPLVAALWNGAEVWRGSANTSPAAIVLPGGVSMAPLSTAQLALEFAPPAPGGGLTSLAIARDDYTVVASFRGGCQLVFSNQRHASPGCSVAAGELVVATERPEVQVNLTNSGSEARLRRLALSWPVRNGALTGAWLGTTALFVGSQAPGSEPFAVDFPAGSQAVLGANTTSPLRLRFATRASRLAYGLSVSFADPGGTSCGELFITAPRGTTDCRLAITRLERETERDVEVYVRNVGGDEIELGYVNVGWPTNNGRNRLLGIYLVDGESEHLLWTGDVRRSPARIPLSETRAAIVDPGAQARLRLHFDPLVIEGDPAATFQVTIGSAEGCQATWPDPSGQVRPERKAISGVIVDLPTTGIWGRWTVARYAGTTREVLAVEINDATRLEPPTVRPAVGDLVQIDAVVYDDRWQAEKVVFLSPEQVVYLVGTIVALDPAAPDGRPAWLRVNALARVIQIVPDTHIDGDLTLGVRVLIEGTLDPSGNVVATRITLQAAAVDEVVTVRGTVQEARSAGPPSTAQVWSLDKYRVQVDLSRPEMRWLDPPYDRLPRPGDRFEVRGRQTGHTIVASRITALAPPKSERIVGTLVALPAGGTLGTWTVRRDGGGEARVLVESAAVVNTSSAPATPGVRIEVVAQLLDGGTLSALSLRTDWPD